MTTTSPAEWAYKLGELVRDQAGTPDLDIAEVAKFLSSLGVPVPTCTVTSWAELDTLPDHTVVIDASGDVAQRSQPQSYLPAQWRVLGLTSGLPSTALALPVTVLLPGESNKAAAERAQTVQPTA